MELLKNYQEHEGLNLDLSSPVEFKEILMSKVEYSEITAEFGHCRFDKCKFSNVTFKNCKFINVSFLRCEFENCEFIDCEFYASVFTGVKFKSIIFNSCMVTLTALVGKFKNIDFLDTTLYGTEIMQQTEFCKTNFVSSVITSGSIWGKGSFSMERTICAREFNIDLNNEKLNNED